MNNGLSNQQMEQIKDILQQYKEIDKAVLFGSRAMGNYKKASDVDITIMGKKADFSLAAKIKSHFEDDSYLPYFFDIISYNTIQSDELKQHIKVYGKTILGGDNKIPNGWVETTLGEVGRVVTGKTPSKNNPDDWENEIDFITPSEIGNETKYIFDTPRKLSNSGLERFTRMILPKNSVVVTCIGSDMGKVILNKNIALTNQQINSIIINENNYFNFIYYLLKNAYKILRRNAEGSGSTMPILNKSNFESLSFVIPKNIQEQKAIAKILTSFDDKIENLQNQNLTLETTAQTIFKEWFGKYQVGDELPEGWRVGRLGDLALKISKGTTPRKKDLEGLSVEIPFLKVKDISNKGLISKSNLELIPKEVHVKQLQRSILETNDILFSIAGTIGRVAIVDDELNNSNCNQALAFIRLNAKITFKEYVYLWLKSKEIQDEINNSIVQGVQANVSLTVLGNLAINIPDISTLNNWKELIKSIYSKLETSNAQIQALKKTRDTLLPKLMSGQLRVNDFKETVL